MTSCPAAVPCSCLPRRTVWRIWWGEGAIGVGEGAVEVGGGGVDGGGCARRTGL